jgi:hypothetical protein
MGGERLNRLLWLAGGVLALLPLAWLLPLRADSQCDWFSHVWVLNQVAECFRHGEMPWTLNSNSLVGVPWLEHYGQWFYGPLGLLSWFWDARLSFKLAALVLTVVQYAAISGALRAHGLRPALALLASLLVGWATYPLTNLLSRGALPEYFANGEALVALALLFWSLAPGQSTSARRLLAGLSWFFLALVFGTHPITALYSTLLIGLLVPVLCLDANLRGELRSVLRLHLPFVLCFLASSAAWLFLVIHAHGQLAVVESGGLKAFKPILDAWPVRFAPLPAGPGPSDASQVPFLDPQVSLPLLSLAGGALILRRRSLAVCVGVLAILGFLAFLSCTPTGLTLLPGPFQALQYRYRLVNQLNAAGLVLVLLALRGEAAEGRRLPRLALVGCALLLCWSGLALWQRGQRGIATRQEAMIPSLVRGASSAERALEYRSYCYGLPDYAWPRYYGVVNVTELQGRRLLAGVQLQVLASPVYGAVSGIRFETGAPAWGRTNVLAHPWNRLLLDGRPVTDADLRVDSGALNGFLLRLDPGRHTLAYVFAPDPLWACFFWLGLVTMVGWAAWLAWRLVRLACR